MLTHFIHPNSILASIFQLFVHVSTAYAFPHEKVVYEKEYRHPSNPHEIIDMIEGKKEDKITAMSDK